MLEDSMFPKSLFCSHVRKKRDLDEKAGIPLIAP